MDEPFRVQFVSSVSSPVSVVVSWMDPSNELLDVFQAAVMLRLSFHVVGVGEFYPLDMTIDHEFQAVEMFSGSASIRTHRTVRLHGTAY